MTTATASESTAKAPGLNAFKPRIMYTAYHVQNIDRALAFYVGVLGMKEQMRLDLSKTLHEAVLQFPDSKGGGVILMWDDAREKPLALGDGYSRFVILVSDLDGSMKHLLAAQTPVVTQPTEAGPMKYALVKDPDGYVLELLELKR